MSDSELVSSRIHLLPEHLVDQIKAGEVIERPANLIKEILENSLDAGSKNISIHLVAAGMELIAIEDDGIGMNFTDLPFAFCRHATSKIEKFEDLYQLGSYGFRGEALASIASISRVTCVSQQKSTTEDGGRIVIHAGVTQSHQRIEGSKSGTSLYIKDLFFNTPARLKFIKSATSEKNALRRVLLSFILTHPQTSFTIKWDDQDKKVYPTSQDHKDIKRQRIEEIFGAKKGSGYHYFEADYEGHMVEGYFSRTSTKGSSYKKHFLFANDRLFTDKQIHQTILRSMEGLYPQGESGHYVVFLTIPPNLLDVNVHPHKTLIKFYKMQVITGLLSSEIKKLKTISSGQESFIERSEKEVNQTNFQESSNQFSTQYQESLNLSHSSNPAREHHSASSYVEESSRLSIITMDEKDFLLGKDNLIHQIKRFMKSQGDHENEFIPLLITEPFEYSSSCSSVEEKLKEWGFISEYVENRYIMLRAYHPLYDLSFAKKLITALIGSSFNEYELETRSLHISSSQLKKLLNYSQISDVRDLFLRPIDNDLIKDLFLKLP